MKFEKQYYKNFAIRLAFYFAGLFIMTIGIALSVKSKLGVSPVSSIPKAITEITKFYGHEINMGNATIILHVFLVLIQVVLLRSRFRIISLLQIAVGIIFGAFTNWCNSGVDLMFPGDVDSMWLRCLMSLVSMFFIALGIFFYMPANIMPLAGEGAMGAVSKVTGIVFHKVKIAFDCTMVTMSLIACIIVLRNFKDVTSVVYIGTVAAAVLVGVILGILNKLMGAWRDRLLTIQSDLPQ